MLKRIQLGVLFLVFVICTYSQEESSDYVLEKEYSTEIQKINRYNYLEKLRLNKEISKTRKLQSNIYSLNAKIDTLSILLAKTIEANRKLSDSLTAALHTVVQAKAEVKSDMQEIRTDIQKVNKTVSSRTNYWIIALVAMVILVLAVLLILWNKYRATLYSFNEQFSRFKEESNSYANQYQYDLESQFANLKETLTNQNNQTKKLVLLNDFIQTLPLNQRSGENGKMPVSADNYKKRMNTLNKEEKNTNGNIDHTLSVKLANELSDMKNLLLNLPAKTRGITILKEKYAKVEAVLNDVGYELIDMVGVDVTDELGKQAKLIVPEGIDTASSVVSKVIIPQINYKDEIIQVATVEVSSKK